MFEGVRRILVLKFKHIGDVLLATPTLDALRETFPEASISFLLNHETAPMIEGHPAVDEVITLDRSKGMLHQLGLLLSLRRRCFDMTVDLSGGGDRGALWSALTGSRYRIGTLPVGKQGMGGKRRLYTHVAPTPYHRAHAVVRDLEIVRPFGIDTRRIQTYFHVPREARDSVRALLTQAGVERRYAVMHPTSRWLFKCADDQVMATCIDRLQAELGLQMVVTCGPSRTELERLDSILAHCRSRPVVFAGTLSLKELGAVLEGACLYVGVDSAPSHLAAALNVPSIVLFGPTGAYNWGPWTDAAGEAPYPAERGIQRAGHNVVMQLDWECVPCGASGCKGKKVSDCLIKITPEQILAEAFRLVEIENG